MLYDFYCDFFFSAVREEEERRRLVILSYLHPPHVCFILYLQVFKQCSSSEQVVLDI